MMVTSYPAARAASSTRNGNRPLPAIRPRCTVRLLVGNFLSAAGRTPQNHPALGRADEIHHELDLWTAERAIALDVPKRARRIQLGLQQIPERPLQFHRYVGGNAAPLQADRVDAKDSGGPAADRAGVWQRVFRDHR